MKHLFRKYQEYTATDFALDDDFIIWALLPNEENEAFWNEFTINNPLQKKNVEIAKSLILSFDTSGETVPDDIKNKIWQAVIAKGENGRIVRMKYRKMWMVAASVIIILVAGVSYFFIKKNGNEGLKENIVKSHTLKNDIEPGGNKAILTLANGSTIILDSAQNGALSHQGNATVIKLGSGKLSYQKVKENNLGEVHFNTITTPVGGQYQLELEDGSKVWLNAASSMRFPTEFRGKERKVEITGEAYFEVKHDASKPFHVLVDGADVTVLGTHFNVNAYNDDGLMKTTLLQGSVKISKENKKVLITPGEQAQIENQSDKIEIEKEVDVEQVMAWKNGKFIFKDADITNIMKQLERWYDIKVSYNTNITKEQFVGVISRNVNLSEILKMLEKTGAVKFEITGRNVIVK